MMKRVAIIGGGGAGVTAAEGLGRRAWGGGAGRGGLFEGSARRGGGVGEGGRGNELRVAAPDEDESVAAFVRRHFGDEVLEKIGAPLLSGVFGGDVSRLSVQAVMAPFVVMERDYGSLITALQARVTDGKADA